MKRLANRVQTSCLFHHLIKVMEYQEALSSLISLKISAEEGDIVNLDIDHLNLAFDWEKSPQGYTYWSGVQEQLLPYYYKEVSMKERLLRIKKWFKEDLKLQILVAFSAALLFIKDPENLKDVLTSLFLGTFVVSIIAFLMVGLIILIKSSIIITLVSIVWFSYLVYRDVVKPKL